MTHDLPPSFAVSFSNQRALPTRPAPKGFQSFRGYAGVHLGREKQRRSGRGQSSGPSVYAFLGLSPNRAGPSTAPRLSAHPRIHATWRRSQHKRAFCGESRSFSLVVRHAPETCRALLSAPGGHCGGLLLGECLPRSPLIPSFSREGRRGRLEGVGTLPGPLQDVQAIEPVDDIEQAIAIVEHIVALRGPVVPHRIRNEVANLGGGERILDIRSASRDGRARGRSCRHSRRGPRRRGLLCPPRGGGLARRTFRDPAAPPPWHPGFGARRASESLQPEDLPSRKART